MTILTHIVDGTGCFRHGINMLAGLLTLAALFVSWQYAVINPDVGVYLTLAENLMEGQVLYDDVYVGYTPLSVYIMAGIRWLGGAETGYGQYLAAILVLHLLNAGLLYLIAGFFTTHTGGKLLAACATVLLALIFEGEYIMLEPFCAFFALMGVYACLRTEAGAGWMRLAGMAVALCFLSKQYGILAAVPVALTVVHTGWKRSVRFGIRGAAWAMGGFALPLILLFAYYQVVQGLAPEVILGEWFSRKGYGDDNLGAALKAWGRFHLTTLPVLILLPLVAGYCRKDFRLWLLVSAWLAFSVPLYLKTFDHYHLLSLPFGVLLTVYVAAAARTPRRLQLATWALGLLMVGSLSLRSYRHYRDLLIHREDRTQQYAQADAVLNFLPARSRVLILYSNGQWLNYLCRFQSIAPREVGYTFPSNLNEAEIDQLLQIGAAVISHPKQWEIAPWQKTLLEKNSYRLVGNPKVFEVWKKISPEEPAK